MGDKHFNFQNNLYALNTLYQMLLQKAICYLLSAHYCK